MKNSCNIAPNKNVEIILGIEDEQLRKGLEDNKVYLERFCFAKKITIDQEINTEKTGKNFALSGINLLIPMEGLIDLDEEIENLNKELNRLDSEIKRCESMLNNPNFINKAPTEKVESERNKLADYQAKKASVEDILKEYMSCKR